MIATTRFVVVVGVAHVEDDDSFKLVVESAARMAKSIAGGELHLVHVLEHFVPAIPTDVIGNPMIDPWQGDEIARQGREVLQQVGQMANAIFPRPVIGHLAAGEPWREIVQCAQRLAADLIIVGSHSRTGIRRMALGSVSEQVVRRSKCPVLVIREKSYAGTPVPEIEPACADCLAKQVESSGKTIWCARHSTHHPVGHVHYEFPQSFALGSELLEI